MKATATLLFAIIALSSVNAFGSRHPLRESHKIAALAEVGLTTI
jgi:hypothetical protein